MGTEAFVTIVGMGLVTYLTRAGGIWLVGRFRPSPRVETWLRQVPGAVLVSIVAPVALTSGPAEVLATVATILVAIRTKSLLLAMIAGVAAVKLLRVFFV